MKVCRAATPGATGFDQLFSFLPPDGTHLLGYDGDQLVSHAVVTTRWVQPTGREPLRTAYVDAVATRPVAQGRGHGTAIMRQLAAVAADLGYAIGCLETGKPGFYARLGWERWRGPRAGRGPRGLIPTPEQEGVMILRLALTPPLDIGGLLTIECQPARIW